MMAVLASTGTALSVLGSCKLGQCSPLGYILV
jgi:hypothetical protein